MTKRKIANLNRAVENLSRALADPIVTERDMGGVVNAFECAYELGWTTLKAYLRDQGQETQGSKDVLRTAWRANMLEGDDAAWLAMVADRNLTVHTYDAAFAAALVERVRRTYHGMLANLAASLAKWHGQA